MDSDEVLEARIAWPGVTASSSAKTACLICIRSGTASTTKSTSPKPSYSVVPLIRPPISSSWRSASSWVIFSFCTRPASCPCVTCRAFSRPWSTNCRSTSLSTTGRPAEAIVCAISPPIVPAPTTAALNTYISPPGVRETRRLQRLFLRRLRGEAAQSADQRVGHRATNEEEVGDGAERALTPDRRGIELVLERQLDDAAAVVCLVESHALDPCQRLFVDTSGEEPLIARGHLLGHPAPAAGERLPDELRPFRGPRPVAFDHVAEALDERGTTTQ